MFSKATEHAIRAVAFLASASSQQERTSLPLIAGEIDAPAAYTGKILQQLVRSGLISASKGKAGGYFLTPEQLEQVHLIHIVRATEGPDALTHCIVGLRACSEEHPCPMHEQFREIRHKLRQMLENTRVSQLAEALEKGDTHLCIPIPEPATL